MASQSERKRRLLTTVKEPPLRAPQGRGKVGIIKGTARETAT